MPELDNPIIDLEAELEQLRCSESRLKERQTLLLRLALSQQNPHQSFDAKLRTFTKEVGNFLRVERTSIWFLDRDNTALRCLNLYVRSNDKHFSGGELPTNQFPRYLSCLSQEGIIAADYARTDVQTEEFDKTYLAEHGITSMLDTPLRVGKRLRGVLCCEHVGEPRHWTEEDQQFVLSLVDLAALTVATHDVSRTEEMLRSLLDSAAQGVVAVGENGKIALVNSLVEKMFLYKRDELLGQPLEILIPQDLCDSYLRSPSGKVDGGLALVPPVGKYFHGQRKDGSEFPVEIALSDVQLHDERMSLALLTDATQRVQIEQRLKKSEELYRSIVEDQVDLIARYTPEGVRVFANDAYCRFLGKTREELIGRSLWEHIPTDDHERMRENFACLTKENPVLYYEHCDVTNGKVVVNQWIDRAIFDANGNLREIQCIGRDVTKQRATEERLTAAERLESIAMLASGIAHDFNNLLTPILIYSENLQTRLRDGSIEANQVQQIYLAADRAKTLVRQILTFGRKGERAERVPTQVTTMLNDALQLIRLSVPPHIRLETWIGEDCGVINSDAAELYQVLSNLCSNACYAMKQGGTLSVSAHKKYCAADEFPAGDYVEITVKDTGQGISPADLNRIFDPFFTTKPDGEGTGLGLSVVHGTVKDLGGAIKVESQVGKGTTFVVLLPCIDQAVTDDRNGHPAEQGMTKSHILLVDDDDLARKSMQLVLKQLGHQVTACSSAQEALSCLSQTREPVDVLLSDFTMPRMSGLELAEHVHKLHPQMPILLITGDAGQVNDDAAREAGISGFIAKPAGSRELSSALGKILHSRCFLQPTTTIEPIRASVPHILVIDDNELVRGSLLSLLRTIGFAPHAAANMTEAKQLLAEQDVDAVLVDHYLDGENGFEEVPRLFQAARAAHGRIPLLIGMTGSEYQPQEAEQQFDAFLTKPFTADQLRDVLTIERD